MADEQSSLHSIYSNVMDWTSSSQDKSSNQKAETVMFGAIDEIFKKVSEFNEYSKAIVTLATTLGALVIFLTTIRIAYNLIQVFRLYVCSQYCCKHNLRKRYGQWAVISGSTDGIGQAMAKILADRGMSILVIGRNEEKLANTKAMLEDIPNIGGVETVKIDLADSSLENFDRIRQQIDPDNRDIGILINNAGMLPTKFTLYNNYDMGFLINCVNCNVSAPMHLTRMIMPGMIKRGRGLVFNVSSILGCMPGPYLSVYAATKAFVDSFTRQLQMEYASHPIDIVLLTPGPVHTNMLKKVADTRGVVSKPSTYTPSSDDFARSALNALSTGIPIYSGTMLHGLTKEMGKFLDSLGLLDYAYRINQRTNSSRYELYPVVVQKND